MSMESGHEDERWDPERLRRRLQAMDDYEFEHLVADLWELQGWDADVEQQSADAGIDVRATQSSPYRRKVLIQAKRYSDDNPVTGPNVQQYAALKQQEPDTDESIIVTTGRFTGSAEDRAKDLNVKLIDGEGLVDLISGLGAYSVVEEYVGRPRRNEEQSRPNRQSSRGHQTEESPTLHRLTPEERTEIEDVLGRDFDDCIQDEQYLATRAMERARTIVELNPHDAKELGVFEGASLYDFEREFEETKTQLVFLKEDVHMNDDGEVYVADLTDYIKSTAIEGGEPNGVVGVIKRGVRDGAWLSEEGREYWETHKQLQKFKKKGKRALSSMLSSDDQPKAVDSSSSTSLARKEVDPAIEAETGEPDDSVSPAEHTSHTHSDDDTGVPTGGRNEIDRQSGERPEGPIRQSTAGTESSNLDLSRSKWFYGIAAATGGWGLAWLLAMLNVATAFAGLLILVSWLLLPTSILMDSRKAGRFESSKGRSLAYVLSSAVPLLALVSGAVYLYRRENSWR